MKKQKSNSKSTNDNIDYTIFVMRFLGELLTRFGFTGLLTIVITYVFLTFPDDEQKSLVYAYLFLGGAGYFSTLWPVTIVGIAFFINNRYLRKRIRNYKDEVTRVGEEKSNLQQILADRELSKSNCNNKEI